MYNFEINDMSFIKSYKSFSVYFNISDYVKSCKEINIATCQYKSLHHCDVKQIVKVYLVKAVEHR